MVFGWGLALPLLVARILANYADHVFALHDAAAFAKAFDGCSYFHGLKLFGYGGQKIALERVFPSAILQNLLLLPEGNPTFGQIVGGHL